MICRYYCRVLPSQARIYSQHETKRKAQHERIQRCMTPNEFIFKMSKFHGKQFEVEGVVKYGPGEFKSFTLKDVVFSPPLEKEVLEKEPQQEENYFPVRDNLCTIKYRKDFNESVLNVVVGQKWKGVCTFNDWVYRGKKGTSLYLEEVIVVKEE